MKIVLWIGNAPNQKALANKIHLSHPISGIVTETKVHHRKLTVKTICSKAIEKVFIPSLSQSWYGMNNHYKKQYSSYPDVEMLDVENINSQAVYDFTRDHAPDLIVVSGTRLIKKMLLSLTPSIGIINLHTGLSPYVKGGPNCTNWCLAKKQLHLIGNTIMWIDAGIDTGNIISTALTPFDGQENLLDVHIKVMDHAHQLYVDAISKLIKGSRSNVRQDTIASGTTYFNKEWTLKEKFAMARNFKKFKTEINSEATGKLRKTLTLVSIN